MVWFYDQLNNLVAKVIIRCFLSYPNNDPYIVFLYFQLPLKTCGMSEALIGNMYEMMFMGNLFYTSRFHKVILSVDRK